MAKKHLVVIVLLLGIGSGAYFWKSPPVKTRALLHVSYDPTRGFYQEYNDRFSKNWRKKTGEKLEIRQSHGGSGKQARSVIEGLSADIVTLALAYDIDVIAKKTGQLPENWQTQLPENSAPYTSTIVFLVRKGNPKNIHDWNDLIKPGIAIIAPNPKTSGAARWAYLAAWGQCLHHGKSRDDAKTFVTAMIKNVPVLDSGSRGATTTFVERGVGDVLLAWENEALLAVEKLGKDRFEIVYPAVSIRAEPPVAVVTTTATKHETLKIATDYLEGLYTPESQRLIAKYHYRPTDPEILKEFEAKLPKMELFRLETYFVDWATAQKEHFDDGGSFDQIFERR
jgi:sulfate transport system substrate-binding protein